VNCLATLASVPLLPPGCSTPTDPDGRPAQEITVACIDVGANKGLASFIADYHLDTAGWVVDPGSEKSRGGAATRAELVNALASRIGERPTALGFEGPLWGTANAPMGPFVLRSFEKKSEAGGPYGWYSGAGAATSIMASPIAVAMLNDLRDALSALALTYGLEGHPPWTPGTLLIWEAFLPKALRQGRDTKTKCCTTLISQDEQDAMCSVEHGFVNFGESSPAARPSPPDVVVPLLGRYLEAEGLVSSGAGGTSGWWREPCLVVEPSSLPRSAVQHWP
jgi:hypothetical protein